MKDKKDKKDGEYFWADLWREAVLATTLGWELAIPIFGGTLIGFFLDKFLVSGHTFTLGLMVAGIGISYYNLWRFIRRIEEKYQSAETQENEENQNGEEGEQG